MLRGIETEAHPAPGAPQTLRQGQGGVSHSSCTLQWSLPAGLYAGATPNKYCLEYMAAASVRSGSGDRGGGGGGGGGANASAGSSGGSGTGGDGGRGGGSGDSGWIVASEHISARAARKLHLQPATGYLFRVRAHLAPAASTGAGGGGGGWGKWSDVLRLTTGSLDGSIKQVRRLATAALRSHTGIAAAPPLPSSTNGQQMPVFPPFIEPPRAVCSQRQASSWLGGGGGGAVQNDARLGVFLRRSRLLEDSFDAMAAVRPYTPLLSRLILNRLGTHLRTDGGHCENYTHRSTDDCVRK